MKNRFFSKIRDSHFVERSILRCLAYFDCVPVNMPTSGHRRPDARHDVGPMSADVGPISGGRRVCPHVPRTSRGPADLGPTSGRYYWPTSARFASRANVGTIFFHCHPDLTPIISRLFPELKSRAGRYHSPTLYAGPTSARHVPAVNPT